MPAGAKIEPCCAGSTTSGRGYPATEIPEEPDAGTRPTVTRLHWLAMRRPAGPTVIDFWSGTHRVDSMIEYDGLLSLDRMERAVEKVRDRLLRSTQALEAAGVPYAVIGGNAVMAWVEQADESAVRFTQDVDLVLRREDLDRASEALARAGFVYRRAAGIEMFLDGPGAKARDAVRVIFSGEKVRPDYATVVPDVAESVSFRAFRVLALEAVVRMKLTS